MKRHLSLISHRISTFLYKKIQCTLQNMYFLLLKLLKNGKRTCSVISPLQAKSKSQGIALLKNKSFLNVLHYLSGTSTTSQMGIDIRDEAISLVFLLEDRVHRWSENDLPKNLIINGHIQNTVLVAQHLKQSLTDHQIGLNYKNQKSFLKTTVVLSIPDTLVLSKVIEIEQGLDEETMEMNILLEASRSLSVLVQEVYMDFRVLETVSIDQQKVSVFFIACHAIHVKDRLKIAMEAGLKVSAVQLASHATERGRLKLPQTLNQFPLPINIGLLTAYGLAQKIL